MKILLILLSILFSATLLAQNTVINDPNAKQRVLNASFSAIAVSDGIDLYLTQGEESLAVSYNDEKYADRFKTVVDNGVLKIYFDNKGLTQTHNRKLRAYVSFKTLEKLSASSGSEVKLPSPITVANLRMKISSGAGLSGALKATSLTVEQNSGATVELSGSAERFTINISSGGTFKGYDFIVDYCEAEASSGGEVRIGVQKELSGRASSGGDIRYKGNGVIKDIDISSGGVIKKV